MKSWISLPTGLSASAVTTAVSRPKQRLSPRATLYSPPPSQALKVRVVAILPSPGSSLSIISPRLTRSHLASAFDFNGSPVIRAPIGRGMAWDYSVLGVDFNARLSDGRNQELDYQ